MPSGVTANNLQIIETGVPGELRVTVSGLESVAQTVDLASVVTSVADPSFITRLSSDLGVSIVLSSPPTITTRVTPVPSPPPPPTPPHVPLSSSNLAQSFGGGNELSTEWLIALVGIASLTVLIVFGCFLAFWLGKRTAKSATANVVARTRPEMNRDINDSSWNCSEGDEDSRDARRRDSGELEHNIDHIMYASNVPPRLTPEEITLVELGMQVQRTREGSLSPRGGPCGSSRGSPQLSLTRGRQVYHVQPEICQGESADAELDDELSIRLDAAEANIAAVRESLTNSPRGASNPRATASIWAQRKEEEVLSD